MTALFLMLAAVVTVDTGGIAVLLLPDDALATRVKRP